MRMTSEKVAREAAEKLGVDHRINRREDGRTFASVQYTNCFATLTVHRGQWLILPQDGEGFYDATRMEHGKFAQTYIRTGVPEEE